MSLLIALSYLVWTNLTTLAASDTIIDTSRIAAGPNGHAVAVWRDTTNYQLWARVFTPGAGWATATPLSDGSVYASPPMLGIASDGTTVAAWTEIPEDRRESRLVARRFIPGRGWGPRWIWGTPSWGSASLALSPDGLAHLASYEDGKFVARTLLVGHDAWSEPTLLREVSTGNFQGEPRVVAGNGFAYAAFTAENKAWVAKYDTTGWHPAVRVSTSEEVDQVMVADLVENKGRVALLRDEFIYGPSIRQRAVIRFLSEESEDVPLPTSGNYQIGLVSDGTVIATIVARGEICSSCLREYCPADITYYTYLQAYHRPASGGDWVGPETISDTHKEVFLTYKPSASSSTGDVVVPWASDFPCFATSQEVLTRVWSSEKNSWEPVTTLAQGQIQLQDLAVDGRGTFRSLLQEWFVEPSGTRSTLRTAEMLPHATQSGDLNRDGKVDCTDSTIVRASLGTRSGEPDFDPRADANSDGVINAGDLELVAQRLPPGTQCPNALACYFGMTGKGDSGAILAVTGNLTYQAESDSYPSVQATGLKSVGDLPVTLDLSDGSAIRGTSLDTMTFPRPNVQIQFSLREKTVTALTEGGVSVPISYARLFCQ